MELDGMPWDGMEWGWGWDGIEMGQQKTSIYKSNQNHNHNHNSSNHNSNNMMGVNPHPVNLAQALLLEEQARASEEMCTGPCLNSVMRSLLWKAALCRERVLSLPWCPCNCM